MRIEDILHSPKKFGLFWLLRRCHAATMIDDPVACAGDELPGLQVMEGIRQECAGRGLVWPPQIID